MNIINYAYVLVLLTIDNVYRCEYKILHLLIDKGMTDDMIR